MLDRPEQFHERETIAVNGPAIREIRISMGWDVAGFTQATHISVAALRGVEIGESLMVTPGSFRSFLGALKLADPRTILAFPHGHERHDDEYVDVKKAHTLRPIPDGSPPDQHDWIAVNGYALRAIRLHRGWRIPAFCTAADVCQMSDIERGTKPRVAPHVFESVVRTLPLADRRAILVNPYGQCI